MRFLVVAILLVTFHLILALAQVAPEGAPHQTAAAGHPYAAAKPIPEPVHFARGRISTPQQGCVTFTSDGKTVYLARHTPPPSTLMVSRFQDGAWTAPEVLPFSGVHSQRVYDGDPALSPDGSRLFFGSQQSKGERAQIWSVLRQGDGWSEPVRTADGLCGPSVASDGTLYFCSDRPASRGGIDIYRSRLVNGTYGPPENLGDAINTSYDEYDPYIAPDQAYLIIASRRPGGNGRSDFYISFQQDGQWTPARNLGLSNAPSMKVCPVVSPDGRYFFFSTAEPGKAGIYQVDVNYLKLRK